MSDPTTVLNGIAADCNDLDTISKALATRTQALNKAEQAWDERYDAVMASLEEEYAQAGRKSVPEHAALSAARRAHRAEYVAWREAKRTLERLQAQLSAKKASLSGKQSELGALREELRYLGQVEQPATHTFGAGRRQVA